MNVYPSFRYQLFRMKRDVLIYYLVYAALIALIVLISLISSVFSLTDPDEPNIISNGISVSTAILIFVEGLCAFKENFFMSVQNGVSRKSLFLGRLGSFAVWCAIMSVMDEAVTLLFDLAGKIPGVHSRAEPLVSLFFSGSADAVSPLVMALYSVAFSFFLLLSCAGLGYFITILYYRLNTPGKVAVSVGVPAFFLIVIPFLKMLRDRFGLQELYQSVLRAVSRFFSLLLETPVNFMAFCLFLFALFSLFAWLLLRRAQVK